MPRIEDFFPEWTDSRPMIYAYTDDQYPGCLKVGYTAVNVDQRVAQQYPTKRPDGSVPYKIVLREPAMYPDGSVFTDHDVHAILRKKGINAVGGEWFRCTVKDVQAAVVAVKTGTLNTENRTQTFKMRPEQAQAVDKTIAYYKNMEDEGSGRVPKFLWNAKMRFGKTFAAYQLAKKMGFTRVLILTFKPAVESAWYDDLVQHVDFEGWQFISRPSNPGEPNTDVQYKNADKSRPIVCFGSFQDFLGVDKNTGGIKSKNEWVHTTNWDLVIFDEYHFGAWKENAKNLFESDEDDFDEDLTNYDRGNAYDETWLPITTSHYLFLSGTPFRALNSGEFIEDQIYNWTYSDEQRAKTAWKGADNPYEALPRMVMLTYKIPDSIQRIAKQGEFDEFDLNVFFSATGKEKDAKFVYEDYVQKWLDLIRGSYLETTVDELKLGAEKPPMPYSDTRLLNVLSHTLWFLPNVASCYAMANLLAQKQNTFYHDYTINICAGTKAGVGLAALEPVQKSMGNPLETKTITLSCGKLTTGVTIKPWTGIFMLRNLKSPETYFQAAFRVQSPWEITTDSGRHEIVKKECYLFDFALDRALKQISDYSCRLNVQESNPEKKVGEFISFLPVLAYDGSAMRQVDAGEILDIAMAGTSATLLAKRWESALLVNVDNETLARLMANEAAMEALMRIEGFRSLNQDIETIINKSEHVKQAKKNAEKLTPKEKKQLSDEEKEYKSKRKQIQEKLIKFATRIPVFMYLTDYREYSLKDVITKLEPGLFKKVTGLNLGDFELLVSLNVFNEALMNDAVYKFKRYEDASLSYSGVNKHEGEAVGLFSTVLSREDYDMMAGQLASSMVAAKQDPNDLPDFTTTAQFEDDDEEDEQSAGNVQKTHESMPPVTRKSIVPTPPPTRPKPVPVPPKPAAPFDPKKMMIGAKVRHKAFGEGTVIKSDGRIITVEFNGDAQGMVQKKFAFPGAFQDGFLSFID
ncbi:MAG: GIY-YIG nuclease family protein [Lachnospiraceae bacterium]|nr:GIY-YIG nuclease family protein [Lachnospiraceae bacterium]MBQ6364417.1 GIY-YIG nuclease family protein [Lachnospiraceae bacterium]MBQ6635365.1 GIY-YIG nuclease family protein [Lachnospiraceae bacterium]